MKPERALVSVSDKRKIVEFARFLADMGVEIISTGGTFRLLKSAGIRVTEISDLTGFPEILDGRVKTLHPLVHGGILAKRDDPSHLSEMERLGIKKIDIVVVNLYPFREVVERGADLEEAIENIDIGGPTLIRASAKNFKHVAVVTDPADYDLIAEELKKTGEISLKTRFLLARKAFELTAHYDAVISMFLNRINEEGKPSLCGEFPEKFTVTFINPLRLRYGENPHQRGVFYRDIFPGSLYFLPAEKVHGEKEISFNNIYDLDTAMNLAFEFDPETDGISCVIVKHACPCGTALGKSPREAYERALEADPVSAFGGIIAFNFPVDPETAELLIERFYECVIAPDYDESALRILKKRKNLRVLKTKKGSFKFSFPYDIKRVSGGILVQDKDTLVLDPEKLKVVTRKKPSEKEWEDLLFAFKVAKWVKSNGVVFARDKAVLAIGAGQTSRVDAVKCAIEKARSLGKDLKGSVLASEAFFPFRDSIDEIAKVGVTAVIQPGGSIRDEEVINSADEHQIAMVFTGIRHFRH